MDFEKEQYKLWNREAALSRLMGNEELLQRVASIFVNSAPDKINLLEEAIVRHDQDAVRLLSHTLKGSAGEIGLERLWASVAQLETLASSAQVDEWYKQFQLVKEDFMCSMEILR
ncbi:Hpt domain-containing protein [Alteromonas pelagimontana]|uniref:Hpt domain-containing protein n=1 Tax=Alteromonas pelagimontana TaxID=1858656 RepID=A0A6M4MAF6_9ALTE|nr:Hpt domain-containing protein [Alteromonas pelagimontana]QJR80181.1 Hpt domain-containing protein [Alteromonas pelagimontana]